MAIDKQLGKYLKRSQKAGMTSFKMIFDQVNKLYLNADLRTKYFYNRIRPNQLAYYTKIRLSSAETRTGHASHPSGHTLQAHFFTRLISDVTERLGVMNCTRAVGSANVDGHSFPTMILR